MIRRSVPVLMGSKPPRRIPNPLFLHASEKAPQSTDVDFSQLSLKYPVANPNPAFTIPRFGWAPKSATTPNYPFFVARSGQNENLPVFTDFKNGRTKVITIVQKISGNVDELRADMEKVVGKPVEIKSGKLIVHGNFHLRLKKYLLALGF